MVCFGFRCFFPVVGLFSFECCCVSCSFVLSFLSFFLSLLCCVCSVSRCDVKCSLIFLFFLSCLLSFFLSCVCSVSRCDVQCSMLIALLFCFHFSFLLLLCLFVCLCRRVAFRECSSCRRRESPWQNAFFATTFLSAAPPHFASSCRTRFVF